MKLDTKSGYWQVPLDDESKDLTTFNTTKGHYRYLRAPMGLTSSSDEFCRRTDEALEGLAIRKVVDDIILATTSIDDIKEKTRLIAQRCREYGITLSEKKFEIGTEVKFAGYIILGDGIKVDPEKVSAIVNFQTPSCVKDVRSFLGLANQLGEFVSDLAILMDPLLKLLKKNVSFTWDDTQHDVFAKTKEVITSTPTLSLFDRKKETILYTDASN